MSPQSKLQRASKGSAQIQVSHGRLQLVFSFNGHRRYLSLGVADTKTARAMAEMKAKQIELDILSGNFDETLEKYQPQAAISARKSEPLPESKPTGPVSVPEF